MVLIGADNYATSIIHHFQYNISPSFHEDTVFQSMLPVLQECKWDYNTLEIHNMRETRTPKTVSDTAEILPILYKRLSLFQQQKIQREFLIWL